VGYSRRAALPVFKLRFEEFPGLVVRARPASLRGTLLVQEFLPVVRHAHAPYSLEQLQAFEKLAAALAAELVGWTLEDEDGAPVPADKRHLVRQDLPFVVTVVSAWLAAQEQAARRKPAAAAPPPAADTPAAPPGPSDDEQLLADLPTQPGPVPVQAAAEPEVVPPESRAVPLSTEPEIAAAQAEAGYTAPEPAAMLSEV
jgi:hypothetical protein